jgi:hypothetical protein
MNVACWPVSADRGTRRHVGNQLMNGHMADTAKTTLLTQISCRPMAWTPCLVEVGRMIARPGALLERAIHGCCELATHYTRVTALLSELS